MCPDRRHAGPGARPGSATPGIRPELLGVAAPGSASAIGGRIGLLEHLGATTLLYITLEDGAEVVSQAEGGSELAPGDSIRLSPSANASHLFDQEGMRIAPDRTPG